MFRVWAYGLYSQKNYDEEPKGIAELTTQASIERFDKIGVPDLGALIKQKSSYYARLHMRVSENRRPQHSTLNSRILILRTPKIRHPLIFGKSHINMSVPQFSPSDPSSRV